MFLENKDKSTRDGIPADEEEIRGAWEEGVKIVNSKGPMRFVGEKGNVSEVAVTDCKPIIMASA